MKYLIIILAITFYCCSPEKNIEVKSQVWTLVDKVPANRFLDGDFVWLIWENKNGIRYLERVSNNEAERFPIGYSVVTRIK